MSDTQTTTDTGAASTDTAAATTTTAATTQTGDPTATAQTTTTTEPPAYKIPDAHKDKSWAAKIKSEDDLYKHIDNLETVVGKKALYPAADATPEQTQEYYNGLRPAEAKAYEAVFDADFTAPETMQAVSGILHEAGISEHQAAKLVPMYQKMEKAATEAATSAEGFKEIMSKSFGEKYDANVAGVANDLKAVLKPEDLKLSDSMPNEYIGLLYRYADAKNAEIAKLKAEYGIKENGDAHLNNKGAATQTTDWREQVAANRAKLREMETRPHTAQEKQALIDANDKLYKANVGK